MTVSAGYRELGPLAEGGMAALSAATAADGTAVVIKRMRPELCFDRAYQQLFEDEGNLAERLDHPNIVRLLDRGEDDAGPFLVFERVEGTDLSIALEAHLKEGRPLELPVVLGVFIPLMRALHAAHEATSDDGARLELVHRDVSPGNILLSDDGDVKLADFGVAKSTLKTDATVAGEMKGKFAYMAPEQTHGGDVDRRADLFAAGVVLYECLTARRLFDGPTDADVVHAVRTCAPESPCVCNPDVGDELSALLLRMLAKDPADRPASAEEVADALYEVAVSLCLETGLKRHVARLARAYPRPTMELADPSTSGVGRRRTQRVIGADTSSLHERRRGRGAAPWVIVALLLGGASATASMMLREPADPVVVEQLPDSTVGPARPSAETPRGDANAVDAADNKASGPAGLEPSAVADSKRAVDRADPPADKALGTGRASRVARRAPPRTSAAPSTTSKRDTLNADATKRDTTKRDTTKRDTTKRDTTKLAKLGAARSTRVDPDPPPPARTARPDGFGKLFLNAKPWANVAIDGASLGTHTPIMGLRLAAGPHLITLTNPVYKFTKTVKVDVPKDGEVRRIVDLTKQ